MQIRKLKAEDLDIQNAMTLEQVCDDDAPVNSQRWLYWFGKFDQEEAYGVFDHDKMVGLAFASDLLAGTQSSQYEISQIIIHPDYRGRRGEKGLGKQLLETMLAVIDTTTPKTNSSLDVLFDNKNAQRLYEAFEFKSDPRKNKPNMQHMRRAPFAHIIDGHNSDHAPAQG